jgi:hypothetical protein
MINAEKHLTWTLTARPLLIQTALQRNSTDAKTTPEASREEKKNPKRARFAWAVNPGGGRAGARNGRIEVYQSVHDY